MADLLTELSRKINAVTEKILSPEQMENLRQDVRSTMREAHSAVRNAANTAQKIGDSFMNSQTSPNNNNRQGSQPPLRPNYQTGKQKPPTVGTGYQSKKNTSSPLRVSYQDHAKPAASKNQKPTFKNFQKGEVTAQKSNAPHMGFHSFIAILGILIVLFSISGVADAVSYFSAYDLVSSFVHLGISCAPVALGSVMSVCGFHKIAYLRRFRNYQKQLKGLDYAEVKDMAQFFHLPEKRIRRDLKKMMADRLFTDCYFDDEETCFIMSKKVYDQYLALKESKHQKQLEADRLKKLQEENPQAAAVEELRQTGETYITKIRQINIDLPEQVISEKLDELEKICSQIFGYVSTNPEKMPQIRKFMSYYLPTTLKLSEAYRDLELRATQTEEIQTSKQEIRNALDNINAAFQNLYSNLMQKDLMGLSADISALETMLTQEGLIEDDLNIR